MSEEDIHKNACNKLNVPDDVSEDALNKTRENNLRNWYPEKEEDEKRRTEKLNKLFELELCYTIIKHRKYMTKS